MDYVACWYAKAIRYMKGSSIRAAFVSTNSITQGEQARTVGPMLAEAGFEIDFAHRTFKWTSEARGKAAVHVIIVGFSEGGRTKSKTIYDYPTPTAQPKAVPASHINIYLADGPEVVPAKRREPLLPGLPKCYKGSQPTDGGHLIVELEDRAAVEADPVAARYLRRLVGAHDMLRDDWRGCLWLVNARPNELANSPVIKQRLVEVRDARLRSKTESVREDANIPSLFTQIRQPKREWLCIPRHSSEGRQFVPMAFYSPDDIAHDSVLVVEQADHYLFGILQSSVYMAWINAVSGRLESRIRIAPDLCYNAFPFPPRSKNDSKIAEAAKRVLDVRAAHGEPLTVLYGANSMPADLVTAHKALDRLVDRLYGIRAGATEAIRLSALFRRYNDLTRGEQLVY